MRIALLITVGTAGILVLAAAGGLLATRLRTPSVGDMLIGLIDGKFVPCPESPNCVSTMADDETHGIEIISYNGSQGEAMQAALSAVKVLPRVLIVSETEDYIWAEVRSLIYRFIDDVEIYVPSDDSIIHFRSASRVGYGDMGVNRRRYGRFKEAFAQQMTSAIDGDE